MRTAPRPAPDCAARRRCTATLGAQPFLLAPLPRPQDRANQEAARRADTEARFQDAWRQLQAERDALAVAQVRPGSAGWRGLVTACPLGCFGGAGGGSCAAGAVQSCCFLPFLHDPLSLKCYWRCGPGRPAGARARGGGGARAGGGALPRCAGAAAGERECRICTAFEVCQKAVVAGGRRAVDTSWRCCKCCAGDALRPWLAQRSDGRILPREPSLAACRAPC